MQLIFLLFAFLANVSQAAQGGLGRGRFNSLKNRLRAMGDFNQRIDPVMFALHGKEMRDFR